MWKNGVVNFYDSGLPSVFDNWSPLLTGGAQIPSFFPLITRTGVLLFRVNELAILLPEVFGCRVSAFAYPGARLQTLLSLYGFAAMLFPHVTKAYCHLRDFAGL
jgi:hypothetical protein